MNDLTWVEASSPSAVQRHSYAVFLVCGDIDQYGHNAVFAEEIGAALGGLGLSSRMVDYRREPRRVQSALTDPDCAFMVCFNGFGSELSLAHQGLGQQLISAFAYYRKPRRRPDARLSIA